MYSKGRAVLHNELLPKFAQFFKHGDIVIEVGKHVYWDYSSYFVNPVRMCDFISIDTNPDLRSQDDNSQLSYWVDDITNSKFGNGSVDGVLFIGMHDNINDPQKAYQEIYRILKPGGRVLVAFPGTGARCGGTLEGMFDWPNYLEGFIIDDVHFVYSPENDERYEYGKNTSILVIARKPREVNQV